MKIKIKNEKLLNGLSYFSFIPHNIYIHFVIVNIIFLIQKYIYLMKCVDVLHHSDPLVVFFFSVFLVLGTPTMMWSDLMWCDVRQGKATPRHGYENRNANERCFSGRVKGGNYKIMMNLKLVTSKPSVIIRIRFDVTPNYTYSWISPPLHYSTISLQHPVALRSVIHTVTALHRTHPNHRHAILVFLYFICRTSTFLPFDPSSRRSTAGHP